MKIHDYIFAARKSLMKFSAAKISNIQLGFANLSLSYYVAIYNQCTNDGGTDTTILDHECQPL